MDIDNNSFVRLVHVLKQKEQDVARIKDTISNGILDENDLNLGDTVKLTKKDNSRTVIGTLLDATIVTIDDNYHKGVVVRPDYIYENVEFSLAEWNIEVIPNSSDNNFVEF